MIKNINKNKNNISLSAMMSRRNRNSKNFQSRRNGSRQNGIGKIGQMTGEMGVGEMGEATYSIFALKRSGGVWLLASPILNTFVLGTSNKGQGGLFTSFSIIDYLYMQKW